MSNLTAGKLLIPYSRLARKKLTGFTGPQGRVDLLRSILTNLMRKERIELAAHRGFEARQYVERFIDLAKKYGDRHIGMMELADYWLLEKDLIPKVFKVIVPRYEIMFGPYTQVHKLPITYPGDGKPQIILELKGNPYPPVVQRSRDYSQSLSNILISAYKNDRTMFKTENKV